MVLGEGMGCAVALADRGTQRHPVEGHPFYMHAGREVGAVVERAVVYTQATHHGEVVGGLEGVLRIGTGGVFS